MAGIGVRPTRERPRSRWGGAAYTLAAPAVSSARLGPEIAVRRIDVCLCTLRGVHTKTTKDGQAERAHPARARLRAGKGIALAVPEVALCLKVGSGRWQETLDS